MGNASIVDSNDQKIKSKNQFCTDILAIQNGFYSAIQNDFYSQVVTQTEQKLISSKVTQHKGDSLHV